MTETRSLVATFSVITPMFLGGAEHAASGFRLTAFKGALRFWWRALEYPCLLQQLQDRDRALGALQTAERSLFGTAASGNRPEAGQSRLFLRCLPEAERVGVFRAGDRLFTSEAMPGACYLGYGLMGAYKEKGGVLERSALAPGHRFRIEIRFRPDTRLADRAGIGRAVRLLGLLGGQGSRVRRGWGSVALEALDGDVDEKGQTRPFAPPQTRDAYTEALAGLTSGCRDGGVLPPFTALSSFSRVDIVAAGSDPVVLLDEVGRQMQRYRAWGFKGRVNGEPSEKNFQDDHDWFKDAVNWRMRPHAPRRAAFGLPHNYYSVKDNFRVNVEPDGPNRRASPLAIHIHRLGETEYIAVLALLPAKFLPDNRLALKAGRQPTNAAFGNGWLDTLHGFIDGTSKADGAPYFPDRMPVIEPDQRSLPAAPGGRR